MRQEKKHMKKGEQSMIYLKNEAGKCYYYKNDKYYEIDKIDKDDILNLIDAATDESIVFEMEPLSEKFEGNEAQKIIYSKLYEKFQDLVENRSRFREESERMYKEAIKKYSDK